ncbi:MULTISPECIES: phosphate signaling complex protein PhoU [Pseudothermotoga]|jgi:phosphate transport system protein|uniref:Phosphate-specific transport system accessory protein PhoU n=1 Tax=Pseudothermotoga lettingae (strain ATCC BAA-301 / DSM 14385 / NBRC 107922 / TMO) TaxID=416591 RepID=A8F7W8_PSELT|nr:MULTISPECIES: phosphate signaling complex protein PhoU [Pseudothermotoga]ABV34252.1 phosphate uptake regulator, PhoU [Pseudothermotoga lettingae TMO]KUK21301.1 MAG: Phosphate-specific transport system accessory protein PhoU [Pseudothermotoga lettingae]MDK2884858.1 phosphate transport system protein [Pseudothermotoga sp.]GLI48803.1 phosphate transport system regulatory protein PhoU [Pseudothermotoga lettingae TMO]HBJ80403.1 phosphate transport system regulatory protein PhoU [Pseudothermotoga
MTGRTIHYEKEMLFLNEKLAEFITGVENLFEKTLYAIQSGDEHVIKQIENMDDYFDSLDLKIQTTAFDIIGKYQPLADDLRFVVAMIGLSVDLERIADECVNIAQLSRHTQRGVEGFTAWKTLNEMIKIILTMFKEIVEAVQHKDLDLAIKVWKKDDQVDFLHNRGHENLIDFACKETSPRMMRLYLEEAFLIRHLERIADHLTNISEKLYFMETGKQLKEVLRKEKG